MKLLPAAAVVVVLGSGVGLAAADTLPAPAQDVAHRALGAFGLHVAPGHERFNDPVECPNGPYRNHGAYVKANNDEPNAGASRCGKPSHAGVDDESSDTPQSGANEKQHGKKDHEAPGHGRGHGKKSENAPSDTSGDEAHDGDDAPDAPGVSSEPSATTTAEAPTTTSTVITTTTTTVADTTSTSQPSSGQP